MFVLHESESVLLSDGIHETGMLCKHIR